MTAARILALPLVLLSFDVGATLVGAYVLYDPSPQLSPLGCAVSGCSVTNISHDASAAQTFTAPTSGQLTQVHLFVGNVLQSTTPMKVTVSRSRDSRPSDLLVDLLGAIEVSVLDLPNTYPGDWYSFDFEALQIDLEEGALYTVSLTRATYDGTSIAWWGSASDPYAGGNFYSRQPHFNGGIWTEPGARFGEHYDFGLALSFAGHVSVPGTLPLALSSLLLLGTLPLTRKAPGA